MSYRDDQDALISRNVALERQVKDLEGRGPGKEMVSSDAFARGAASLTGIACGTGIAVVAASNWYSVQYMWMGCVVAAVSAIAPFIRLSGLLRPFTIRSQLTIACCDQPAAIALIAIVHFSRDRGDRERRAQLYGSRTGMAHQIARDMVEGVLREQLGSIAAETIRTDSASVSLRVQEASAAALAGYGLRVERVFVSAAV